MNTATPDRYSDGTYLADNAGWHDEDGKWKALKVAEILRRNNIRPRTVCDVGCGTGRVLGELSDLLPETERLIGFDLSEDARKVNRAADYPRIELVTGDARTKAEKYDLLMMIDVFEHVEDYISFLRSFRTYAEAFVFHIPLDLSVQAVCRVNPILRARQGVGHLHYFCRETALATLADAGYRIRDEIYTCGAVELPRSGSATRFARFPRMLMHRTSPHWAARLLGGFSLLALCEPA